MKENYQIKCIGNIGTFCTSSLAVKNLRTSLDVQKQSFLFSGDSTWLTRDRGLFDATLDATVCYPLFPFTDLEALCCL